MLNIAQSREIAYYYPNPMWQNGDWIKNLILFFDGVALLVPDYLKDKPDQIDPAIVEGLRRYDLLTILSPEKVVDADATKQLVGALVDITSSGALDNLSKNETAFHELSMSRLGFYGDEELANSIFDELKQRGLAKNSADGKSIPMHPMVRSLILTLLSQILRAYGPKLNAELSPVTDRPKLIESLAELLQGNALPSTGAVVAFDLSTVGVDLGSIPIDEILDFRSQNLAEHRRYCLSVRQFTQEISSMPFEDRHIAFELRQAELDDLSADLRKRSRKAWKKPSSLALSLVGAAVSLVAHHPLAACLSLGASGLGYTPAAMPQFGAYSYLFRANQKYGY